MAKELYVGHLPYEMTNDDLRRIFGVAGTVTSVHIITDPDTGKSKVCGYVRMSRDEELTEAITCLDGALVEGMTITVSIANPPKATATRPKGTGATRQGSRRDRARRR